MKVLVCPHTMEIGGSQSNAIELAAAVRDLGHEVAVYSAPGPLVERLGDLGLEHVVRREGRSTPSPSVARHLVDLATERGFDVIHGYEWPPVLEAYAASWATGGRVAAVGTVMSMSVAPFLPQSVPLVVGTAQIRADVQPLRRGPVTLIEPPVDVHLNAPDLELPVPAGVELDPGSVLVVSVCRLVADLKLEGLLTAVRVIDRLAETRKVQLLLVGDGGEGPRLRGLADQVNRRHDRPVVVMAGEWLDPRWAYATADVCLGMGGSALRAMAFAKPLVVQGEGGFFRRLTPATAGQFLDEGWYGVEDHDREGADDQLANQLEPLLEDAELRVALGRYGRDLVSTRFSLESAARVQEQIYRDAVAGDGLGRPLLEPIRSGVGLVSHKLRRRVARWRGTSTPDDFNARRR
jgi:glycosyltransferase involved in cell wall biosynthesis